MSCRQPCLGDRTHQGTCRNRGSGLQTGRWLCPLGEGLRPKRKPVGHRGPLSLQWRPGTGSVMYRVTELIKTHGSKHSPSGAGSQAGSEAELGCAQPPGCTAHRTAIWHASRAHAGSWTRDQCSHTEPWAQKGPAWGVVLCRFHLESLHDFLCVL